MLKKLNPKISLFIGLLIINFCIGISSAMAQGIIKPVATTPQQCGDEFDVEIKVENVQNLFGVSFELHYTHTQHIDALSTQKGDFLGTDVVYFDNIDDANGVVSIGITRKAPAAGVNGNGVVAKVRLTSAASTPNGTPVQFTVANVTANDPTGAPIVLTPQSLTVTIQCGAGSVIKPVGPPQVNCGDEFEVEIQVENVQNLFGVSFELHYTHTQHIDALSTQKGDFLGTDVVYFDNIDDANGVVSIGITRKAPAAGVNGNGVVAKVRLTSAASTPNGTPVQFTVANVTANDPAGAPIVLTPQSLTVTIICEHTVTITDGPTANPTTVAPGGVVDLSVTAVCSLGHAINYSWAVEPQEGTFDNPNQQNPKWTAPQTPGTYTFTVTATCSVNPNVTDTGTVQVTVSDGVCPKVGDVSGDGTVSAYDAALILQFVVGIIDKFPVEFQQSPITSTPQSYSITVPHLAVATGNKIQAPIIINDASGVASGGVVLRYDAKVLRAVTVVPTSLLSGYYWQFNTELDGEVRIAFAGNRTISGDKVLFYVEFEALSNNIGKVSPLTLEVAKISENLDITKFNGSIAILPPKSTLLQNYPNPFNPETWVPYFLVEPANATLKIYSTTGKLVRTLDLGYKIAGIYLNKNKAAYWDGKDEYGESVASGVYFYSLQAGKFTETRKMVIVK